MPRDNRAYYDAFAERYDDRRADGYHALLDELEAGLVVRHARGGDVLEAGCGTGLILERVRPYCRRAVGVDLSLGMLQKARARGHRVAQAAITALPFPDASFDLVCSFKVLPHVEPIRQALAELGRLVRPGGVLIAEFYNPRSVRGLLWKVKPAGRVAAGVDEKDVFVRFDTPQQARGYLPPDFAVVGERGARVVTLVPQALRIPLLSTALRALESELADPLAAWGSFYSVVARRNA
ncbi:MAG: class I SAM-dependent methyltransferase [Deltaproteobacteria bacterium]|nr:class I SAM-dependent methyltransferase [Deltaproteobacteria bacterium]